MKVVIFPRIPTPKWCGNGAMDKGETPESIDFIGK